MPERKKIIAIPGSLSQRSANMNLINAMPWISMIKTNLF